VHVSTLAATASLVGYLVFEGTYFDPAPRKKQDDFQWNVVCDDARQDMPAITLTRQRGGYLHIIDFMEIPLRLKKLVKRLYFFWHRYEQS